MTEDEMVGCITNSMDMSLSKLWEIVKAEEPGRLQPTGSQRVRHDLATEQQQRKRRQRLGEATSTGEHRNREGL